LCAFYLANDVASDIFTSKLLFLLPFEQGGNFHVGSTAQTDGDKTLNFILIDGTWSNSNAMFGRLKVTLNHSSILCFCLTYTLSIVGYMILITNNMHLFPWPYMVHLLIKLNP
jgi:hypothetical protein